ncbi:hypothetical protein [Desulfogranum marinum]|uniref:hypothetical protein n=1 Tax=Desulfogranum marinum TaxID=453220 RepID=UPI0019637886|nr:hypothetical protein [Desulfogranum marinum]MBM9512689.1 hypothetical protein [Desulfogranum marinum]
MQIKARIHEHLKAANQAMARCNYVLEQDGKENAPSHNHGFFQELLELVAPANTPHSSVDMTIKEELRCCLTYWDWNRQPCCFFPHPQRIDGNRSKNDRHPEKLFFKVPGDNDTIEAVKLRTP